MTGIPSQRAGQTNEPGPAPLPLVDGLRPSPLEWIRRRRAERDARRVSTIGSRAVNRLGDLGPGWHVIEWPIAEEELPGRTVGRELAGFLVIGIGGVYAITVVDHGRNTVLIAGDVVQVNGKRPPYVIQARKDARHASRALSTATGHEVPAIPVLVFEGTGRISTHGLPRGCLLTSSRELERMLLAGGERIGPRTADKLARVARDIGTWVNRPYHSTEDARDRQSRSAANVTARM